MKTEYLIPDRASPDGVESALIEEARLCAATMRREIRTYYDSFDWRLYSAGIVLPEIDDGTQHTLIMRPLHDTTGLIAQLRTGQAPVFTRDFPPGRMRDLLTPVLEMRELVPRISTRSSIRCLAMLNKDDKTVARVLIEETDLLDGDGTRAQRLDNRVILLPVKGYRKAAARIASVLKNMALVGKTPDPMLSALDMAGITPGDYSTKLDLQLSPDLRGDRAIRLVLHRLLEIMLQNEAGMRKGTDTEFLHDFRVAVRRTRSALGQVKGVLPPRILERYKREFAWLGSITSTLRDLDVYLLKFDDYRKSLPPSSQDDIEPLRTFLHRHREAEHAALIEALDTEHYRRLLDDWKAFLEQTVDEEESALENASRPIYEIACERIWRVYRRVLKQGNAIRRDTPAEALHELRKTAKKLRYLMEFFQSLYPSTAIQKLIMVLKDLQTNLGDFQDYEVQVHTLRQFSERMVEEDLALPGTRLAMGILIEGLEHRQHRQRREFADRFAKFSRPKNQARFRAMFASPSKKGKSS